MPLRGVSIDSRSLEKDQLFIALKGDTHDGHRFVGDALDRGAAAAVVERSHLETLRRERPDAALFGAENTLTALQQLALHVRKRFSIPFIGITGSVGKTSAKEFTAAVLARRYRTLKSKKSFNNAIGVPLTLLELREYHQMAVLEMGTNHFGEIAELCRLALPHYGVILNIAEAHLEFFKDLHGVLSAKMELFENLSSGGAGFYNADDAILAGAAMPLERSRSFGLERDADLRGFYKGMSETGCAKFVFENIEVQLRVAGRHNIYNALAAAAVGLEFGLTAEEIKDGLESVERLADRSEICSVSGVYIIDDVYNSNLRSAAAALELLVALAKNAGGKKIAVFADMLELGEFSEDAHRELGRRAAQLGLDALYAYGPESAATVRAADGNGEYRHFEDKATLLRRLLAVIEKGDVVLVKGSRGMAMEEIVRGIVDNLKGVE